MPTYSEPTIQSISIVKETEVSAPPEILFAAILEEIGSAFTTPNGPMPMKLEAWPGGRWFRDLGNNAGHLWGHVQVIKPPTLIELTGPLMMSFPAISHLQYRITGDANKSTLQFTHRSHGLFPKEFGDGVSQGWAFVLERIRNAAQAKAKH